MKTDYHLVISTGLVHGVYGAALKAEAEEHAKTIPLAYVITKSFLPLCRPRVGLHIGNL